MSLIQSYPFTTGGNYTYGSNVSVSGGKAQLALLNNTLQTFNEDFADDTGFTYDSSKAEFVGGLVRQKNKVGDNAILGGSFASAYNLDWRVDGLSATGVANGSPSISTGRIRCNTGSGVSWPKVTSTIETYKFTYSPLFTGSPGASINIATWYNGSNNNDMFALTLDVSNNLELTLYDSSASSIISTATHLTTWSPTSGVIYEFMVVLDSVAGTVRIFIDGVLVGTNSPGAWTRGSITSAVHVGSCTGLYNASSGFFDIVICYDDAQETGNYTPGYTVPANIYDEVPVTLPTFDYTGLGAGAIQAFSGFSGTVSNVPKFIMNGEYWNGAAWAASSDTYATASTIADILTNIGTLSASDTMIVKAVFTASTSTQGDVSDLTVGYTGQIYDMTNSTIEPTTGPTTDALENFVATVSEAGSDLVKYALRFQGALHYYSGGWVIADGTYAQTNTAAEIVANMASWDLSVGGTLIPVIFLHSEDGTTTPDIDLLTIDYSFFNTVTSPTVCKVFGEVLDNSKLPVVGAVVTVDGADYYYDNALISRAGKAITDSDGKWELDVVETATDSKTVTFTTTYQNLAGDDVLFTDVNKTVPNQPTAALSTLV